ncbi:MAG: WbuC family cupin fold metalloprotein [Bacteroidales bacterium]|nr:WbuC family cupin fold metalloprotein [Bacteroidales bacterium]
MIIDKQLLDTLSAQAKASPRLRQAYDLRNMPEDNSQRMLNALEPGTVMPIHRHRKSSESICMVRGKMVMRLYDDNGNITDEFVMAPTSLHSFPSIQDGECNEPTIPMVQVEAGQWHSLEVLEERTVVFEAKDGKYEPLPEEDIMK